MSTLQRREVPRNEKARFGSAHRACGSWGDDGSGWQYRYLAVPGPYLRMVVGDIDGRMVEWLELRK